MQTLLATIIKPLTQTLDLLLQLFAGFGQTRLIMNEQIVLTLEGVALAQQLLPLFGFTLQITVGPLDLAFTLQQIPSYWAPCLSSCWERSQASSRGTGAPTMRSSRVRLTHIALAAARARFNRC